MQTDPQGASPTEPTGEEHPTADRHDSGGERGTGRETAGSEYAERLERLQGARWKQVLDVQRPYRWNLGRLDLGRTLDVGCGVGRNLHSLRKLGVDAVGVDHNQEFIDVCRMAGLQAWTTTEFLADPTLAVPDSFDSVLVAHVLEHVDDAVGDQIVSDYLPFLRPGGKVVVMTPQEVGYRSDKTHVRWVDQAVVAEHAQRLGLKMERSFSFPFPRPVGKLFIYNEFVSVLRAPG